MISIQCHKCGKRIVAEHESTEVTLQCRNCEAILQIACSDEQYTVSQPEAGPLPSTVAHDNFLSKSPASGDKSKPAGKANSPTGTIEIPGYEILSEIGRGGMGVVYKPRHLKLNRIVALKMILSGAHAGTQDVQRFLSEAEAVAAFQHPNIVQVYEIGEHRGLPHMALEYVDGCSLAARLRESPLPPNEAARIVEQIARGINAAHQSGIVHRDLKPANVLLTKNGTPKVTDFGLAKRVEGGDGLTHTGAIMGTPSYMAPEQAAGDTKRIAPATDVYALGAVLYTTSCRGAGLTVMAN